MAQGLSADTLLSSAVDEDGVLVRRCCRASLDCGWGWLPQQPRTERQVTSLGQVPGAKTGNSELMESYVKEKVKEVEALDPEM